MFGRRNSGSGCSTGCLVITLILIAVAIFLIITFAWVFLTLLLVVLGISALVGTVLTLRNYFMALRESLDIHRYTTKPSNWRIPNFLYKWVVIAWETIKISMGYTVDTMKDHFQNASFHKLLSLRKWFHIFVGLSVIIFGLIVTVGIVVLHFYILFMAVCIVLALFVTVLTVFCLVGIAVSSFFAVTNYINRYRESCCGSFFDYVVDDGFGEFLSIIKEYWQENIDYIRDGVTDFNDGSKKDLGLWVRLGSSIMLVPVGVVWFVLFAGVHIVVQSLLFGVFKLISLFKR